MLLQPWTRGRLLRGYQRGRDAPGGVQGGSGTRVPAGPRGRWRMSDTCVTLGAGVEQGVGVCPVAPLASRSCAGIFGEFQGPDLAHRVPVLSGASCWVPRGTPNSTGRHPRSHSAPNRPLRGTTAALFPLPQSDAGTVSALWVASCCATSLSPSLPGCSPWWHRMPLPHGHHRSCCPWSLGQAGGMLYLQEGAGEEEGEGSAGARPPSPGFSPRRAHGGGLSR